MATFQLCGGEQLERFSRLYEEQRLCDLTLEAVEGGRTEKFNVHRVFLATTSDYWERLLAQDGFVESGQQAVCLRELAPSTLALLLHCVYGLKVALDPENTVRVINAADRFGMARLQSDLVRHFHTLAPTPSTHPDFFLSIMAALAPDPPPDPQSSPAPPQAKRARVDSDDSEAQPLTPTVPPLGCVSSEVATYCKDTFLRSAVEFLSDGRAGQVGVGVMEAVLSWAYHTASEADLLALAIRWATATGSKLGPLAWLVRYPLMSARELAGAEEGGHVPGEVLLQAYKAVAAAMDDAAAVKCTWPQEWLVPRLAHTVVLMSMRRHEATATTATRMYAGNVAFPGGHENEGRVILVVSNNTTMTRCMITMGRGTRGGADSSGTAADCLFSAEVMWPQASQQQPRPIPPMQPEATWQRIGPLPAPVPTKASGVMGSLVCPGCLVNELGLEAHAQLTLRYGVAVRHVAPAAGVCERVGLYYKRLHAMAEGFIKQVRTWP